MSAENPHKDNTGAIFPASENWRAQATAGKTRPHFNGEATVLCQHCQKQNRLRVAGWSQTAKKTGQPFVSLAFSVPREKGGSQ